MGPTNEADEILLELQKIDMHRRDSSQISKGDIVRWSYEWPGDHDYGCLYMVTGYNSENIDIIVTRMMSKPYDVKEFHVSQLTKV